MTSSQRRRERRARVAAHVAAGTHVPVRRSHYQTGEIRDVVQGELGDMRQRMKAQRDRLRDGEWAFREDARRDPLPVSLFSGVRVPDAE